MKHILVTGGAGFVGSVVAETLIQQGYRVTVIDNLSGGNRSAVDPKASLVVADLADEEALAKLFKSNQFDGIMHFAAEALIDGSMTDPYLYFFANDVVGLRLLEAARQHGVKKFVFSSTSAVYGLPKQLPMRETDLPEPINSYGLSKLIFEQILQWYQKAYGFQIVCFRYFNAAGATQKLGECRPSESHLIPIAMQAALGQRSMLHMFGTDYDTEDGTCVRDFTHVKDIAQAHILGFEKIEKLTQRIFNLGSGRPYSVRQVIELTREISQKDIPVKESPRRPGDVEAMQADIRLAKTHLGWDPKHSDLKTILQDAWQWHVAHPNGYADTAQTSHLSR